MIGGKDVVIPSKGGSAALDICARIIRCYWPDARFEDAVTGDKYHEYGAIPLGCVRELLVYHDAQAERAWDADDANSPENSMLYFIRRDGSITVVLDDPDAAEMPSILVSLRNSLRPSIHRNHASTV